MESSFLICIVVAFLVPLIFKSLVKEVTIKDEYKTIFEINAKGLRTFNRILLIILLVLTLVLNLALNPPLYGNIILICCIFISILLNIASRFNVTINGDEIIYTPSFSKSKKYKLDDITVIKIKNYQQGIIKYSIYANDKIIFSISNMLNNTEDFINLTRKHGIKFEQEQ